MSRRTRKINAKVFPAVSVAAFRKELVAYYERNEADFNRAKAAGILPQLMAGLPTDSIKHMHNEVAAAKKAELFWVSDEICQQAFDASQDVPHISALDAPSATGILIFQKPLPPLPLDQYTRGAYLENLKFTAEKVGLDALQNLTSEAHGVMWAHLGRGMLAISVFGIHGAKPSVLGQVDPRIPLGFFDIPLDQTVEIENISTVQGQQAFLAFLSSLWILMKTPTVAQVSEGDISTGKTVPVLADDGGNTPTYTVPDKRRVQVVEMVPMLHKQEESEDSLQAKRTYRKSQYKWVVRGHWRNQRVGKNREQRQLTWVASYLKGNPEGQLKTSEKVYSWRRPVTGR